MLEKERKERQRIGREKERKGKKGDNCIDWEKILFLYSMAVL